MDPSLFELSVDLFDGLDDFQQVSYLIPEADEDLTNTLYALFMQATEGPSSNGVKPSFFDLTGHKKYAAWKDLGEDMSKEVAMALYVEQVFDYITQAEAILFEQISLEDLDSLTKDENSFVNEFLSRINQWKSDCAFLWPEKYSHILEKEEHNVLLSSGENETPSEFVKRLEEVTFQDSISPSDDDEDVDTENSLQSSVKSQSTFLPDSILPVTPGHPISPYYNNNNKQKSKFQPPSSHLGLSEYGEHSVLDSNDDNDGDNSEDRNYKEERHFATSNNPRKLISASNFSLPPLSDSSDESNSEDSKQSEDIGLFDKFNDFNNSDDQKKSDDEYEESAFIDSIDNTSENHKGLTLENTISLAEGTIGKVSELLSAATGVGIPSSQSINSSSSSKTHTPSREEAGLAQLFNEDSIPNFHLSNPPSNTSILGRLIRNEGQDDDPLHVKEPPPHNSLSGLSGSSVLNRGLSPNPSSISSIIRIEDMLSAVIQRLDIIDREISTLQMEVACQKSENDYQISEVNGLDSYDDADNNMDGDGIADDHNTFTDIHHQQQEHNKKWWAEFHPRNWDDSFKRGSILTSGSIIMFVIAASQLHRAFNSGK